MALDKQRILNELGDVVNQLQNADCGCMGNVFSKPACGGCGGGRPMGNPLPTCGGCRRGMCPGHGYGVHYNNMSGSGDPYSMNAGGMGEENMHAGGGMDFGMGRGMANGMQEMGSARGMGGMNAGGMPRRGMGNMGCMGRNAPALYANTYSYLNENLMQPVMKEVYNDLSTITPENTIGTNPLAAKMGLPTSGNPMMNQGGGAMEGGATMGGHMGNPMQMGGSGGNPMGSMGNMGGATPNDGSMGAQIVNMMMSGGGGKSANAPQASGLTEGMLINAPNSPHGQVGVTPLNPPAAGNMGMGGAGMNPAQVSGMPGQGNPAGMMQTPVTQYVTQDNMYHANSSPQANTMSAGMNQHVMNANPAMQPMDNTNPGMQQIGNTNLGMQQVGNTYPGMQEVGGANRTMQHNMGNISQNPYGVHNAGIKKFNEMFPGVMQGGDLKFDPMAIAVQMNPANQKRAAIDQMTKLMNGNKGGAMMQPAIDGRNAAAAALGQNQITAQQALIPGQQYATPVAQGGQEMALQPGQQYATPVAQGGQQQLLQPGQQYAVQGGQQLLQGQPHSVIQPNQQQVYTAITPGAPVMNQQDPNGGALAATENPYAQIKQQPGQEGAPVLQEPVTAYNAAPQYHYNTLGQPVELLPGNTYHAPLPTLPQTLGGSDLTKDYGIRNTISKTAIARTIPIGSTASRSQLQHIYRQYKASHSASHGNIRPAQPIPVQRGSASVGMINNTPVVNPPAQNIPVENVGGDTIANNQQMSYQPKMEQLAEHVGDAPPANSFQAGDAPENVKMQSVPVAVDSRGRNGLQDLSFTPYKHSKGWTFHG